VISTKKKKVFGILDFVGKQETDSLKRLFASIDIITKENVIRFRRKATVFKQTQEIVVLTMYITTNLDGSF
jgi:hypothetical protein